MGWADQYIKQLAAGMTVSFRPRGKSMTGLINDGQLVTVQPYDRVHPIEPGTVVLCKVKGRQLVHKVLARKNLSRYKIGNNKGFVNGWIWEQDIYGVVIKVED